MLVAFMLPVHRALPFLFCLHRSSCNFGWTGTIHKIEDFGNLCGRLRSKSATLFLKATTGSRGGGPERGHLSKDAAMGLAQENCTSESFIALGRGLASNKLYLHSRDWRSQLTCLPCAPELKAIAHRWAQKAADVLMKSLFLLTWLFSRYHGRSDSCALVDSRYPSQNTKQDFYHAENNIAERPAEGEHMCDAGHLALTIKQPTSLLVLRPCKLHQTFVRIWSFRHQD